MQQKQYSSVLRIFFAIIISCYLYSCENNLNTVNLVTASDKTPLGTEENAVFTYTDSGHIKFRLTAPLLERYGGDDPHQIATKGVNVDFYDDSNHVNGHISANYAIRYEKTGLMEGDNNVVVVNKKGEKLNTEQLFWSESKHRIYTNKYVQIRTASEIIYGDGLESNEDFTDYKITNIRGTVLLNTTTSTNP